MRSIKFRAWHKEKGMITNPTSIGTIVSRYIREFRPAPTGFGSRPESYEVKPEEYLLMQFTGLYDKHGKEIWEGDRVKHDQHGNPLVVTWDWDQWGLFDGICNEASIGKDDVEVVGNIYEN